MYVSCCLFCYSDLEDATECFEEQINACPSHIRTRYHGLMTVLFGMLGNAHNGMDYSECLHGCKLYRHIL